MARREIETKTDRAAGTRPARSDNAPWKEQESMNMLTETAARPPVEPSTGGVGEMLAPLIAGLDTDQIVPVLTRGMVALVQRGEVDMRHFASPEAFQAFLDRHGIDPIDLDPDLSDLIAETSVRLLMPEGALAEFGEPEPLVAQAIAQVNADGGLHKANITMIVRDLLRAEIAGGAL